MPPAVAPEPPPQPHDALFKWTFSQREHAAGLLRASLPATWAAKADFRTLRLEHGNFVSRALRRRHGDLVFSIRVRGKKIYFYVLVEQQRKVEALMVVRMGIYVMRLYEELLRDHPKLKEIPAILPLLVHHSDAGWKAATAFQDVVALDAELRAELWRYVPHFEMRVIDLHEERPANLAQEKLTSLGKVVLWALSVAGDDARLEREIAGIGPALADVLLGRDHAALEALLRYLAATHQRLRREKIGELVESAAGPEAREVIVTWLDELKLEGHKEGRTEGRAEGRTEGRAEGRVQVLLEQLRARFGAVPAEARARIQAADEATLSRWAVRVLTASSLDDVLAAGRTTAAGRKSAARRQPRRV